MKQFPFPPFKILPPFPHFFITQWNPSPSFGFCFCFCFCPPSPSLLTTLKSPSSHWWRLWKGRSFVTKGGSVKAGRSIAVIIPFLITFRPINLRISSPRGTLRLLTLQGFGIIDLLLRRRLCFSLMDLVPPVGSLWGWRKLLLFLVMLAAKLLVSFFILFLCFLFLIICVGLKFDWMFQVAMEWRLEVRWRGVCAITRSSVLINCTVMNITSSLIPVLLEFLTMAVVPCLSTGMSSLNPLHF